MKFLCLAALIISLSATTFEAIACGKEILSGKNALDAASMVFQGKVENLQYLDPPEQTDLEPRIIVTFSVKKLFKGEVGKQVIIHTTHNKSSCNGYVFEAGKEYLVYTKENKKRSRLLAFFFPSTSTPARIGINVYGGTKPLSQATTDIDFLRKNNLN
jgi:hypothetical protein